jgi:hypothetical protein
MEPPRRDESMNTPLRLLLVDDHSIVREGLRALLDDEESLQIVGRRRTVPRHSRSRDSCGLTSC